MTHPVDSPPSTRLPRATEYDRAETDAVVVLRSCPVCEGHRLRVRTTPGRWIGPEVFEPLRDRIGLAECRDCGLVFVNPRPASHLLGEFYAGETYDCHETGNSSSDEAKIQEILTRVEPILGPSTPRTVLDYGAGGGGFLLGMRARGWQVTGFEPGRRGLAACRAAGLRATDRLSELPEHAFGLVTLHHVFEHIEDPRVALTDIKRLLAPGGRLFIEVPNARSLRARLALPALSERAPVDERFRAFPIHLVYYDPHTLGRLLTAVGWTVDSTFTVGLGLDEFLIRDESGTAMVNHQRPAATAPPSWRRRAWLRMRNAYLDLGLGENVAVIAHPR